MNGQRRLTIFLGLMLGLSIATNVALYRKTTRFELEMSGRAAESLLIYTTALSLIRSDKPERALSTLENATDLAVISASERMTLTPGLTNVFRLLVDYRKRFPESDAFMHEHDVSRARREAANRFIGR